ncbi:MAG: hypothetical protein IAG10_07720 [Planctomycetaceae bacterium]|nr:hypothetical protein [Planctomycetaceae bacterium]
MATKLAQIEERLSRVETELAELKKAKQQDDDVPWYRKIAGQFNNDPVFDEIVRLGKEIRDNERSPKRIQPSKSPRRKKA